MARPHDSQLPDLTQRIAAVEARLQAACARVGRARDEVTLVAVSKLQSAAAVRAAARAGLTTFGENRVQEARDKQPAVGREDLDWHLLGPLQSNKVGLALDLFSTFHAVDRVKIARALERELARRGETRRAFLQVNVGGEASKHGVDPREALAVLEQLRGELEHLDLVGLMSIPPPSSDPEGSRPWHRQLRDLRDRARQAWPAFPGWLSMGMSTDFEVAIEEGATHCRVGTDLFGERGVAAAGS